MAGIGGGLSGGTRTAGCAGAAEFRRLVAEIRRKLHFLVLDGID